MSNDPTASMANEPTDPATAAPPAAEGEEPKGDAGEAKPDQPMIPKARLDKELAKKRELEAELAEFRKADQKTKDERAKAEGNIASAQQERDSYKVKAERWEKFATDRLEEITAKLGDEEKDILGALPDDVDLSVKLAQAEKLAGRKKPDPSFGSKGGGAPGQAVGKIPAEVQTPAQYRQWIISLENSGKPEDMLILVNPKEMAAVREEAGRRKLL